MAGYWDEARRLAPAAILFAIGEGNQLSGATVPWLSEALFAFAGVAGLVWLWPHLTKYRPFAHWKFQLPIARIELPGPPLESRVRNMRNFIYVDRLASENLVCIGLKFLNASDEHLTVESVDGHLEFNNALGQLPISKISWANPVPAPMAKPFDEFDVEVHQHLPNDAVPIFTEKTSEGRTLSIEFHLRIRARGAQTGKLVELRPWQGIACAKQDVPVVTGQLVFINFVSQIETGATDVRK